MVGTYLNNQQNADMRAINGYCYVAKLGVFAGRAVLALSTVTLGRFYYITTYVVNKSIE